jgi:hypothetical protein
MESYIDLYTLPEQQFCFCTQCETVNCQVTFCCHIANSMKLKVIFEKLTVAQFAKEFPPFIKPEGSLQCSQEPLSLVE